MLKALMIRKKLTDAQKELEALRAKSEGLAKREAELEASINEMTEETPAEDRAVVEGAVDEFNTEHEQHETDKKALEEEIRGIEEEIEKEEKEQRTEAKTAEVPEQRGEIKTMETRKFFWWNKIGIKKIPRS